MSPSYDDIELRYISDGHATTVVRDGVHHESWKVRVTVNGNTFKTEHVISDPLPSSGQTGVNGSTLLVDYIQESVRHRAAWQHKTPDQWQQVQQDLAAYRETLWNNLTAGLPRWGDSPFRPGAVGCHLYITEESGQEQHAIHKLAWELLEDPGDLRHRNGDRYTIGVTRRVVYSKMRTGPAKSFRDVQLDPKATFRILLVIARNLSNPKKHDLTPDIAQYPLMMLQEKFRKESRKSRLYVEIVRPGTLAELDSHLRNRWRHGVKFNLVHFDMHGKVFSPDGGPDGPKCFLRFGHSGDPPTKPGSLEEVPGRSIVNVLDEHRIDCVVLNSCFSASCMYKPAANLSRELVRFVGQVSSMWHRVNHKTARLYIAEFYKHLLVDLEPFATTAHKARLALWQDEQRWGSGRRFTDAFVCVNYQHAHEKKDRSSHDVTPARLSFHQPSGAPTSTRHFLDVPGPMLAMSDSFQSAGTGSNISTNGFISWSSLPSPISAPSREKPLKRLLRRIFMERSDEAQQPSNPPPPAAPEGHGEDDGPALDTAPDEHRVAQMTLIILDLELALTNLRVLYARKSAFADLKRAFNENLRDAIALWLRTSMIRRVSFYQARSFQDTSKPRPYRSFRPYYGRLDMLKRNMKLDGEARRPEPLAETLHVILDVDDAVTEGEERDDVVARNMGKFLERLDGPHHTAALKRDYAIFVGENDDQWWKSQWWTKSDRGEQTWHGGYWDPATFHSSLVAAAVREIPVVAVQRQSIMNL
ncbi:hypothetical protein QBC34DRAFT_441671 [Podospora aff. communis PSN243]|uniref:CHAT domain-containing protein n=1 Tax=Podospora aff. communis PSN243 TaxID=3040156 RepID=A0AAV9GDF6_9PEZI|nr:hypothetical protein QBC34DRAFT_441671 [Podospora aff. communis PSN243]